MPCLVSCVIQCLVFFLRCVVCPKQMVKHPMNFERMRARLNAGEYDDRRRGLNEFKEDLAWIVYNCKLFNGVSCVLVL